MSKTTLCEIYVRSAPRSDHTSQGSATPQLARYSMAVKLDGLHEFLADNCVCLEEKIELHYSLTDPTVSRLRFPKYVDLECESKAILWEMAHMVAQ